jgi:hypothetical protein
MAFNGDGQKFVGDDGIIKKSAFGAEVVGDGSTALTAPGTYLITKVNTTSGFPAPALGGDAAAAGDVLVLVSGDAVTPTTGEQVVTLTLTDQCDISSWEMNFSKERIETSVLCDSIKKYRDGMADMEGNLNGIFTAGTTDSTTGSLRQFIRIVKQDGDQSFDSFSQQNEIMIVFFYVNESSSGLSTADDMYVVAAIQMTGQKLGAAIGESQSFESGFGFANYTYTDSNSNTATIEPTFYRLGDGT